MSPAVTVRLSLLLCMLLAASAHAVGVTVPAASPSGLIEVGSAVNPSRQNTEIRTFGAHQAALAGGQARAALAMGSDDDGVPFISFSAGGVSQFDARARGTLRYSWAIQGQASSAELVPVTITTLGHISGSMTAQAVRADARVEVSANWLGMLASSSFDTAVAGGVRDRRTYGVGTIGYYQSVPTTVMAVDPGRSLPGGSVSAGVGGSFSDTFSLMVLPGAVNTILMQVDGSLSGLFGYLPRAFHYEPEFAHYAWQMSGYVDPIITIDPAYASRFSVVQSDIPMVPVPEASTWAMLLAGLCLVAGGVRRRSYPCRHDTRNP